MKWKLSYLALLFEVGVLQIVVQIPSYSQWLSDLLWGFTRRSRCVRTKYPEYWDLSGFIRFQYLGHYSRKIPYTVCCLHEFLSLLMLVCMWTRVCWLAGCYHESCCWNFPDVVFQWNHTRIYVFILFTHVYWNSVKLTSVHFFSPLAFRHFR